MTTTRATPSAAVPGATHAVMNQPPALEDYDLFTHDPVLTEAVAREGASWAGDELAAFGTRLGEREILELGHLANRHTPTLRTHDRFGHRLDTVDFHPAWHELMALGVGAEIHALPWNRPGVGAHVARAAKHYLLTQVEAGVLCPITMAFSSIPALRLEPSVAEVWEPRVRSTTYDPRFQPAAEKDGALLGMAMTEKQGGSDVRANTTRAKPAADGTYRLTGHKWFCSAPMCDGFLTLAHLEEGVTCFLVPRFLPDGERNRLFIQRLKDKLGNRSNASSEIEYHDTWAQRIGPPGRGIPTILEMVAHTRLDCMLGSAALMRQALVQAFHHCRHRHAFGRRLVEQPLMRNVLADLALEWEAATALALRVARAYDAASTDGSSGESSAAFRRIATAIGKYWVCKRTPGVVVEALECHGGNGYVEESVLPRLYREAPLSSIWEGSGNVMCLDVLRALTREPATGPALWAELDAARGADRRYDAFVDRLKTTLGRREDPQLRARRLVEDLAMALQASLLLRHGTAAVADAFCAARLAGEGGREYGTLPSGVDLDGILTRIWPC